MAIKEIKSVSYKKIDDKSFIIDQNIVHEDSLTILEQFQELQIALMNMKQKIKDAKGLQEKFIEIANMYNDRCNMMQKAKEELGFDYIVPELVAIPEDFNLLCTNPDNLPVIVFDWPKKEGDKETKK